MPHAQHSQRQGTYQTFLHRNVFGIFRKQEYDWFQMQMKQNSIVIVYVSEHWAVQANMEAILGEPKTNTAADVKAFAVRLGGTDNAGIWVQSVARNEPKGNEARMFIPWTQIITIAWRPNMEADPKKIGF
jgi:hypothetical protein